MKYKNSEIGIPTLEIVDDKDTKELAMAEKYIAKHINRFCESMKIVRAHDMAKFGKLLSDLRTSLTK